SGPRRTALGRYALEQRLTSDREAEPGELRQSAVAHAPQDVLRRFEGGAAPLAGPERRRFGGSPRRPAVPAQRSTALAQHARGLHTADRQGAAPFKFEAQTRASGPTAPSPPAAQPFA